MPIEIGLWKIDGGEASPVASSSLDREGRLEEILERDITILGLDILLIVGRQVRTSWGKLTDLLCIDAQGDLFVIELKRDRTPREVVAQALDYGSWGKDLGHADLVEIFDAHRQGADFETASEERFGQPVPDEINQNHRLIVAASELDPSTERIIDYLSDFEIPINAVFFRYFKDGEDEYLARSWLIDPGEVEVKTTPKKRRPWNQRDIYISFGHGDSRRWEDARRYGFVAGGGDPWYSRTLNSLKEGGAPRFRPYPWRGLRWRRRGDGDCSGGQGVQGQRGRARDPASRSRPRGAGHGSRPRRPGQVGVRRAGQVD
jgi:hypothetical protein